MQASGAKPDGQVADADIGNWVDRSAPVWSRPYLRLSRADRPAPAFLLLIPCWWSLLLAILHDGQFGWTDIWVALGCTIGAFLMRGAGCTWNDINDRHFDARVERTKSRPIPAGQVTVTGALVWLVVQCLLSFAILLTFNVTAILLGILSLLPVAVYPFAKRFTWWPQVFLGLAFNWGALLGWTAHTGAVGWPAVVLYLAGISWTLFYDTIYAHQDTEDDALIGIKSTARLFAEKTPQWLALFLGLSVALFLVAVWSALEPEASGLSTLCALLAPLVFGGHMLWQWRQFDAEDNPGLLRLFRSNRDAGLIPLIFLVLAILV